MASGECKADGNSRVPSTRCPSRHQRMPLLLHVLSPAQQWLCTTPGHKVYPAVHLLPIHTSKPASARQNARLTPGPLSTHTADDSSSPCCSSTAGLWSLSFAFVIYL